jgi:hypothetical protein
MTPRAIAFAIGETAGWLRIVLRKINLPMLAKDY